MQRFWRYSVALLVSVPTALMPLLFLLCICFSPGLILAGDVEANVRVIIDKLPIDKEQKMRDFHLVVKKYIDNVEWLEEKDRRPIKLTLQLFLTESVSNVEDRYKCEFLISGKDVQYFDKRVRFPYQPGDQLIYDDQSVGALTGVLNFYVNLVLGSELDKYHGLGGDIYYKRALSFASLGKFVRTQFIIGWTEREERIKQVFVEPFTTFRKMKDYYFYGLYVLEEEKNPGEARDNIITALNLIEKAMESKDARVEFNEPKQFIDAHHTEIIELFKSYGQRNSILNKLIKLDPDHKDLYAEYLTDS